MAIKNRNKEENWLEIIKEGRLAIKRLDLDFDLLLQLATAEKSTDSGQWALNRASRVLHGNNPGYSCPARCPRVPWLKPWWDWWAARAASPEGSSASRAAGLGGLWGCPSSRPLWPCPQPSIFGIGKTGSDFDAACPPGSSCPPGRRISHFSAQSAWRSLCSLRRCGPRSAGRPRCPRRQRTACCPWRNPWVCSSLRTTSDLGLHGLHD